jgi:hypothetical protein
MLVKRGLALLEEAYRAGGGIYESLKNAADDSRNILWLKVEKKSEMILYLLIVYIVLFCVSSHNTPYVNDLYTRCGKN